MSLGQGLETLRKQYLPLGRARARARWIGLIKETVELGLGSIELRQQEKNQPEITEVGKGG